MGDNVFIFTDDEESTTGSTFPTMITPKCVSNSFPIPQ